VQDSLIQWRRDSMFNSSCHSINVMRLTVAAGVTLVAGLLVSAPALGAVTHVVETQASFPLLSTTDSNGNLLVTGDLLKLATPSPENAAGHGNLNDDLLGDPTSLGNSGDGQSSIIGNGPYTYALPAPSDIGQIRLYSGWNDSRAGQVMEILVSTNNGANFTSLYNYNAPGNNVAMQTTVFDNAGFLATGVTHIRFDPLDANPGASDGPGTVYREFDVIGQVVNGFASLTINRQTGAVILDNASPQNIDIIGYSITSTAGGFARGNWTTIAGHYDATPANGGTGNGSVDVDDSWIVLSAAGSKTDLSEAELDGGNGGKISALQQVSLGTPWLSTPYESGTVAELLQPDGTILSLPVVFDGLQIPVGDLTGDGQISGPDWAAFKAGQGSVFIGLSTAQAYLLGDLDGDFDHDLADFGRFEKAFDVANGSGSFVAMLRSANVPEPASFLLIVFGGIAGLMVCSRRARSAVAAAVIVCIVTCATSRTAHAIVTRTVEREPNFAALTTTNSTGGLLITNDLLKTATTSAAMPASINNDFLGSSVTAAVSGEAETTIAGNGPYTYALAAPSNIEQIDVYSAWMDFRAGQDLQILFSTDGVNFTPVLNYKEASVGNEVVLSTIRNNTGLLGTNVTHVRIDPTDGTGTAGAGGVYREIDVIAAGLAPKPMELLVNTVSGKVSVNNQAVNAVLLDSYRIFSPSGSLNATGWSSLADRPTPVAGFPQGNGNGAGWEEGPASSANELVEWYLDDELAPSSLAAGASLDLGTAFNTAVGQQDLLFSYRTITGTEVFGSINYVDTPPANVDGDFNGDNRVDAADYTVWRDRLGSNTPLPNDNGLGTPISAQHYALWKQNFGQVGGAGSLAAGGTAVPEPSTIIALFGACCGAMVLSQRRRRQGEAMSPRECDVETTSKPKCRWGAFVAALCVACAVISSTAQAAIYNERVYRLGDDPTEHAVANTTVGSGETQFAGDTLDSGDPNSPDPLGDPSGSYLDLTQAGSPQYVDVSTLGSGRTGLGVRFDGTDDMLRGTRLARPASLPALFPGGYPINYNNIFSRGMQAWAYVDADGLAAAQAQTLFWDAQLYGGPQISAEGKWTQANSNKYADTANRLPATVAVVPDTWLHVMHHVYNATDPNSPRRLSGGAGTNHAAVVYVNGVAVSSNIDNLQANFNYATSGRSGDLIVGAVENNGGGFRSFFNGAMDDLEMYVFGNNETGTVGNLADGENWGTFDLFADNKWIANQIATTVPGGMLKPGDVNKDGEIDTDDIDQFVDNWLYQNLQTGATSVQTVGDWLTWDKGDMNHDGITNLKDAFILHSALSSSGAGGLDFSLLGGGPAVPEPSSIVLAATLGTLVMLGRRNGRK
jgi:hypothetical protein